MFKLNARWAKQYEYNNKKQGLPCLAFFASLRSVSLQKQTPALQCSPPPHRIAASRPMLFPYYLYVAFFHAHLRFLRRLFNSRPCVVKLSILLFFVAKLEVQVQVPSLTTPTSFHILPTSSCSSATIKGKDIRYFVAPAARRYRMSPRMGGSLRRWACERFEAFPACCHAHERAFDRNDSADSVLGPGESPCTVQNRQTENVFQNLLHGKTVKQLKRAVVFTSNQSWGKCIIICGGIGAGLIISTMI